MDIQKKDNFHANNKEWQNPPIYGAHQLVYWCSKCHNQLFLIVMYIITIVTAKFVCTAIFNTIIKMPMLYHAVQQ
jgi:hypothetical protein